MRALGRRDARSQVEDFDEAPAALAPSSFERLYRRHGAWLVALLRLRYGREFAEDLVQDTFLKILRVDPATIQRPRAYLLHVAINAARDRRRRQIARPPGPGERDTTDAASVGAQSHQHEDLLLRQIVLTLPPYCRDPFVLSRFGGLTYEEISAHLGISVKTVEHKMSRALKICAERLREG